MSEKITGLPIIGDVDLCVLGGKLYTVYRALSLAKQGKKVLLAIERILVILPFLSSFLHKCEL